MEQKPILVRKEKSIAWILLNRPEKLNAIDLETLEALESRLDSLASDQEVRCILLRGAGDRAFSAGADVSQLSTFSEDEARKFSETGQRVFKKVRELQKPIIAIVNGYALGGGCELAAACDLRIASEKARFSQSEVNLGIIPGWGGTQVLPRIVGLARAKEMIMLGRMVEAGEAYSMGLVNKVVPPEKLDEEAMKLAEALAAGPPKALSTAKRLLNLSIQAPLDYGLRMEAEGFAGLFSTDDFKEGVAAFREKRTPAFKGR